MLPEEGWSGYDTAVEIDTVRVVVVEVDSELYDTDDRIKTEDLIRKMLVKTDLENDIERLYE